MEKSVDYTHYDLNKKISMIDMPYKIFYLHICEHYKIPCCISTSSIEQLIVEHRKYFIKKSDKEIEEIEKMKQDGLQRFIHLFDSYKKTDN
jgi:hypothetical protein